MISGVAHHLLWFFKEHSKSKDTFCSPVSDYAPQSILVTIMFFRQ